MDGQDQFLDMGLTTGTLTFIIFILLPIKKSVKISVFNFQNLGS